MRLHIRRVFCFFFLLILSYGFWSSTGDGLNSESTGILPSGSQWVDLKSSTRPAGRSLKSHYEDSAELVALLNGTIYFEDKISGKVLWSFSSGAPIYSSYQAPFKQDNDKENSFGPGTGFFVDYGDDWQLYAHGKHSSGMKLSMNIEDFIKITPHISEDGAVILGSKKTTVFVVEAKTGKLVRTYNCPDSSSVLQSDEGSGLHDDDDDKNRKDLVMSGSTNTAQVIYITRTDYALQTFGPNSDKVSWSIKVAMIEAAFLCKDVENPKAPFNLSYELGSEIKGDFDSLFPCQSRRMVVRRQDRPRSSSGVLHGDDKLSLPVSNLVLPLQAGVDEALDDDRKKLMLPGSAQNPMLPSQPQVDKLSDFHHSNGGEGIPALPTDSVLGDLHDVRGVLGMFFKRSIALPFTSFIVIILFGLAFYHHALVGKENFVLKGQPGDASLRASPSKRKKSRKSGRNNGSAETKDNYMSSENVDGFTLCEGDNKTFMDLNKLVDGGASGRQIGKLFVSNTEIAKGSNGTIVLEGMYEGRPVAVKRLVQAHHDVAFKEIQNLIASDRHPNIVRWYGVEYDKDFVYLSLERCTCSLDDLIQIYSDSSVDPVFSKDEATRSATEYKLRLDSVRGIMRDLNLWKANGCPSRLLLTLMKDVVSGLAHLHELGIIHRDLKPQNVLIIKDRSLCAKLSDMGISRRLLGDMSSLGHHATGCGSSGWQAPEQLLHGRQTRAVDLFSLGCVLFFCITGGRHPFGGRLERDINIVKNQMDLCLVKYIPEAEDLISRLLNPDPELRPKALEVLCHPMFWSSEMRLSFFRDTSDRVELEDRESDSDILKALESIAPIALGGKWNEKMEPAFITNIGYYRRYRFDSIRDLLRVMRNKLNHYRELPKEIQELVGPVPEGYDGYFASRFPRLLIEVYKVVHIYCSEEECFHKYFKSNLF